MDASTIFMKKSMTSYKETNYGMPSLDLFQLTSELNRPYPQTKFESLNNLCSGVNNNPIGIIRENKPFYVPSNQGYNLCSIEDYENIKQIIKNIPIYRDVYTERTITVPKPINIAVGLYEVISTPDFRDWNYFYENNPKIACNYIDSAKCNKGCDLLQNNWSSFQTSISSGSNHDSSHPLNEDNIQKSINLTHDIKNNIGEGSLCTAFNMTMNTYANQPQNYGPILVPEGSNLYIPPGYIRVDAQNKSNCRATKQITNCEHTNRKHYAKGLCSTCYHKGGRTKLAWNCEHKDRLHYAKGCCTDCYVQFHSTRGKGKRKCDDELEQDLE